MGSTRESWLLGLGAWTLLVLYGFWLAFCESRAEQRRAQKLSPGQPRPEGVRMNLQDLLYLFVIIAVFAVAAAYVRGCDQL